MNTSSYLERNGVGWGGGSGDAMARRGGAGTAMAASPVRGGGVEWGMGEVELRQGRAGGGTDTV
jgi:hypothetical protein